MVKKTLILAGLILLLTSQVNAQGLSLGPQVGYYKAQDADGTYLFGAALRLKLLPFLGVEAAINYRQEKYAAADITLRSWPVMVTGLVYLLPILYGAVGAGWYNTTVDYSEEINQYLEDETMREIGWHFGGGIELPLGSRLKLAGDIRYVFLNYDFDEVPGTGDVKSNFYVITAGLLFVL